MTSTTPTQEFAEPLPEDRGGSRNRRADLLAAAILLLVVLVFLKDAALMRGTFYAMDVACQNLPIQFHFSQALRSGHLPLWTPQLFCGFPLHAEGQGGLFYPLNLLFQIRPIYVGLNLYVILHTFLAGLFIYWFARTMRISTWGALLAGIAYSLSALVSRHHGILNHFGSLVWIPVPLALLNLWVRNRRPIWVLLGGLALGIEWLAGHPQFSWMAHLCLAWLLLYHLFAGSLPSFRQKLAAVGAVALMVAIGLGLAMVQLLPMRELSAFSERSQGALYQTIRDSGLPAKAYIDLISPAYFGKLSNATALEDLDAISVLYVGIAPLMLIAFAFRREQRIWSVGLLVLAVVGALLSLKELDLAARLIAAFPPASLFRYRQRYAVLFVIALVLLAGRGFDALISGRSGPAREHATGRPVWLWAAGFVALVLAVCWSLYAAREGSLETALAGCLLDNPPVFQAKLEAIREARAGDLVFAGVFFGAATVTLVLYALGIVPPRVFAVLMVVQLALNGLFFGTERPPLIERDFYSRKPAALELLDHQVPPSRVYSLWQYPINPYDGERFHTWNLDIRQSYRRYADLLSTDLTLLYGVDNLEGFPHSLRPRRFLTLNRYINATGDLRVLGLCNARYVSSIRPITRDGLTLILDGPVMAYRNTQWLPRAFLVHSVVRADNEEDAFYRLIDPERDLSAVAVVEDADDMPPLDPNTSAPTGTAQIVDYQATHVQIDVQTPRRGLLVLTDTNYPGWQATIDGQPARIYQTDFLFRGVVVEPGTHRVTFDYRPASFRNGLLISAFALVLLAGAIVWALRTTARESRSPELPA